MPEILPPNEFVIYPHPERELIGRRLQANDVTTEMAARVTKLLVAAYTPDFDDQDLGLATAHHVYIPPGTIKSHFGQSPQDLEQRAERLRSQMHNGAEYWALSEGPEDTELLALAKTTPSRPSALHKLGLRRPNCYLADVVSLPQYAYDMRVNKGFGSAAVHAALRYGRYASGAQVVTDIYRGTPTGDILRRRGFNPNDQAAPPDTIFNGSDRTINVSMQRWTAPSVGTVVNKLEHRRPWLNEGRFHVLSPS